MIEYTKEYGKGFLFIMSKEFNVTAVCIPEEHYMVNIDGRLKEIKSLVDASKYFTINRARQYGKTTTLMALEDYLQKITMLFLWIFKCLVMQSLEQKVYFLVRLHIFFFVR